VTEGTREKQGREIGGINYRTASWLARAVWVLTVVELPLSAALLLFIPASSGITDLPEALAAVVFAALILALSTVGVLIATRQPHNLVGWIMLVAGFALGATVLTGTYVDLSVAQPRGRLPGKEWVAWFAQWIWVAGFAPALTFLLLLFPNGRLPSGRWRLARWLAVAAMTILGFGMAFTPGPFVDYPKAQTLWASPHLKEAFWKEEAWGGFFCQQIKWFALAAAFAAVGWVAVTLAYRTDEGTQDLLLMAAQLLQLLTFLGLALAVGIAVLKYRLYDIDLLINRTLVYGALTVMLAVVYFGGVERPRRYSAHSPANSSSHN
jgi:MFS family permease